VLYVVWLASGWLDTILGGISPSEGDGDSLDDSELLIELEADDDSELEMDEETLEDSLDDSDNDADSLDDSEELAEDDIELLADEDADELSESPSAVQNVLGEFWLL